MSIDKLLEQERKRTGRKYPIILHTGKYEIVDGVQHEWIHRLIKLDKEGKPQYTTGLKRVYK